MTDGALAVEPAVLEALEGKAIAGYTPGADRPAYRGDLHREAINYGEPVRVLAKPFDVDGRNWIDHEDRRYQKARVLAVTTPDHLPVDQLQSAPEMPHPRRSDPLPLPAGSAPVVAVDAVPQRGAVRMVELDSVEPVDAGD